MYHRIVVFLIPRTCTKCFLRTLLAISGQESPSHSYIQLFLLTNIFVDYRVKSSFSFRVDSNN